MQLDPEHADGQVATFATTTAGATWWVLDQLARHGPGWHLVPPICFGLASLVASARGYLDGAQQRRHRDELHRLDVLARAGGPR